MKVRAMLVLLVYVSIRKSEVIDRYFAIPEEDTPRWLFQCHKKILGSPVYHGDVLALESAHDAVHPEGERIYPDGVPDLMIYEISEYQAKNLKFDKVITTGQIR